MEGQPSTGTGTAIEMPEEGLYIHIDEGVGPDETVFRLHRNRVHIGDIRPHGELNQRKFVSSVLTTPCCLECQMAALLADFDRRHETDTSAAAPT